MLIGLYVRVSSWWNRTREERGAVSTEYALLLVLIALAIIAAAGFLGAKIAGVFSNASSSLDNVG